jgi:CubicO group peptidase (beta-lactamase class C family)
MTSPRAGSFAGKPARLALIAALALAVAAAMALALRSWAGGGSRLQAPPPTVAAQIDALFARFAQGASPGCAVAVVERGRVAYARGYGFANLERRVPISPRTVFDIASTSKQFTAACVLLLAQQRRLSLDDDVRRYVPELPAPPDGAVITLRHLLYHTSGLPDYIALLTKSGKHLLDVTGDADALAVLAAHPSLEFRPGSNFHYSDSGYFLLSLVVKQVTGQTLRQFAAANLFAPLGMRDTEFLDDESHASPQRAAAYAGDGDGDGGGGAHFRRDESNWNQTGDGAVNTTVLDLAKWDDNFYTGAVGGKQLVDSLMTPGTLDNGHPLSYAGGLTLDDYRGQRRVRHAGSWVGYSAELMRLPDRRLSVITLCNLGNANPTDLCQQITDLYLDPPR